MKYGKVHLLKSMLIPAVFLAGCAGSSGKTNDRMSRTFEETIDSSILRYDGCREEGQDLEGYCFVIVSENAEGSGEEIRKVFESAEQVLQTEEYKDQKVSLYIEVPHYDPDAYCIVAYFENYDEDGIYDYLCRVTVNGLDDSAEMYQEEYSYEVNDADYWNSYPDLCSINFTETFRHISE